MRDDLVLIHPPSIYDFRERSLLFGPISDVVPSTPVFEMYPIGFATLSQYLCQRGFQVRIVNLAVRMLHSRKFDPERYLTRFKPLLFGLDLHWLPHVQGAIAIAEVLKKVHPDVPIVMGGLSASYFHREILENYPQIDFVVRGDCAEEPVAQLLEVLKKGGDLSGVQNLSYRRGNQIIEGVIDHVPDSLNPYAMDYRHMMRQVCRRRDPVGYSPFKNWFSYPITAILAFKGCRFNCVTCGGSACAMKRVVNRDKMAFKDPEVIAREVASVIPYLKGPVFFLGDLLLAGRDEFRALMDHLRPLKIKNQVAVEFFTPPEEGVLEEIAATFPRFNIEISPESHDETVRKAFGRTYDNRSLENLLRRALKLGCGRIDLFFMTGIPKQDLSSVLGTVDYCRDLLNEFGSGKKVVPFISPLAPFVDPGSLVFENPEKYGYQLRFRALEDHRRAMLSFSWKGMLNYQSKWMSRDDLVSATYQAGTELTKLKAEYRLLKKDEACKVINRAARAMALMDEVEAAEALPPKEAAAALASLRRRLEGNSESSVCQKRELNWPVGLTRLRLANLVRLLLTGKGI